MMRMATRQGGIDQPLQSDSKYGAVLVANNTFTLFAKRFQSCSISVDDQLFIHIPQSLRTIIEEYLLALVDLRDAIRSHLDYPLARFASIHSVLATCPIASSFPLPTHSMLWERD